MQDSTSSRCMPVSTCARTSATPTRRRRVFTRSTELANESCFDLRAGGVGVRLGRYLHLSVRRWRQRRSSSLCILGRRSSDGAWAIVARVRVSLLSRAPFCFICSFGADIVVVVVTVSIYTYIHSDTHPYIYTYIHSQYSLGTPLCVRVLCSGTCMRSSVCVCGGEWIN